MAATTTLTLGLVLREAAGDPYQNTREATAGPDIVASVAPPPSGGRPADLAGLRALAKADPASSVTADRTRRRRDLKAKGQTVDVGCRGRDATPARGRPARS